MSWMISLILAGSVLSSDVTITPVPAPQTPASPSSTILLDETERFEQTYPLSAGGTVSVSNVNGSIEITTWDRNEVKLEAVKTANTRELLSEVELEIESTANSFSIETEYRKGVRDGRSWKEYGKLTVAFKLVVPRGAVLDEIETVNGSVTISDAANSVDASVVNGNLRAFNLRGNAELSSVNGSVEATFDELPPSARIDAETVNGTVTVAIPGDANATVRAETVNGRIANDFGLPVRKGEYVGRDLYGRIGSGEAKIELSSVNGALTLKRRADGKTMNSVVNLLPAGDSTKFDSESRADAESARVDRMRNDEIREVSRIQREAAEKARKELELARVEMMKEVPEMVRVEMPRIDFELIRKQVENGLKLADIAALRAVEVNFPRAGGVVDQKSESFVVKGSPKVTINAPNSSVHVRGWDRDEVKYQVTQVGSRTPVGVSAEHNDSSVTISVAKPADGAGVFNSGRIRLEVFVPKKSDLRITTNREIRLENVSGELDLTGAGDAVNIVGSEGNLRVAALGAPVRIIGFTGAVDARTTDGSISLEGQFARVSAASGTGDIVFTIAGEPAGTVIANTQTIDFGQIPVTPVENRANGTVTRAWRLGGGDSRYDFNVGDGRIFLRSVDALKSTQ